MRQIRRSVLFLLASALAARSGQLVNEDWTDGTFGDPEWVINHPAECGFSTNYSRDTNLDLVFDTNDMAFVRELSDGGSTWGYGCTLDLPAEQNIAADEAVFVRYESFQDCARGSSENHGTIVSILDWELGDIWPPTQSIEAKQLFNTKTGSGARDMYTEASSKFGGSGNDLNGPLDDAHGRPGNSSAGLGGMYEGLFVWRRSNATRDGGHKVNSEGTGSVPGKESDQDIDAVMMTKFDQVTLQIVRPPTGDELFASNASLAACQHGVTRLEIGITKVSDYNLDYAIDGTDFSALSNNWGLSSRRMEDGDGDNDADVDIDDFFLFASHFTGPAPPGLAAAPGPGGLGAYVFTATGEIRLFGTAVNFVGYKISSPGGALVAGTALNAWNGYYATSTGAEISDLNTNGGASVSHSFGTCYNAVLDIRDLTFLWQPSLGTATMEGEIKYIDPSAITIEYIAVAGDGSAEIGSFGAPQLGTQVLQTCTELVVADWQDILTNASPVVWPGTNVWNAPASADTNRSFRVQEW